MNPNGVSVPECPSYHPSSELKGRSGYYPNLTEDHMRSVRELDALLEAAGLDIATDSENIFLKKLRFLRARSYNPANAFEMLKKDTEMRREPTRANLRFQNASDVLQCDLAQVYNYFPSWVQGFDKQDRPIAWRHFGSRFEIWNILKLTTMERLVRFHAWEGEQALRIMRDRSEAVGYNIETFVVIIDAKGWHPGLATSDAFTYIKGMATTDSDHYPERLGRLLVINAPFALSFAWKIISKFLDSVTKQKIQILGTDPKDWQKVMFEFIDPSQVPLMFGGTAPDPTPEDAINSINPPPELQVVVDTALDAKEAAASVDVAPPVDESVGNLVEDFQKLVSADDEQVREPETA